MRNTLLTRFLEVVLTWMLTGPRGYTSPLQPSTTSSSFKVLHIFIFNIDKTKIANLKKKFPFLFFYFLGANPGIRIGGPIIQPGVPFIQATNSGKAPSFLKEQKERKSAKRTKNGTKTCQFLFFLYG